jgi:hypothetical protein
MKLYHASLGLEVFMLYHKLFPDKKLSVLKSFGNIDNSMKEFTKSHRKKIESLIFDSGTWTLNNGKTDLSHRITLPNYKNYVTEFFHYFDFYFNFDSDFIGGSNETNYQNQIALEECGLRPVPVVHDIKGDEIDHYIDKGYPIVALGSTQIKSVDTLDYVMNKFKGTGIKVHLFGNTKFDFISNFPIYSCDSTAWANTGGYGYIKYWNPKKEGRNKTDTIYMEEYLDHNAKHKLTLSNYEYREELYQYLSETLSVTEQDLLGPDGAYCKQLVNLYFYVQLEEIINKIHQDKGFHSTTENHA